MSIAILILVFVKISSSYLVSSDRIVEYLHNNNHQTKYESSVLDFDRDVIVGRFDDRVTDQPPEIYDWRDYLAVTPVKDQMNCSASWAFAINAAIESQRIIYEHRVATLSEQFLIDCLEGTSGCKPGNIVKAYSHIIADIGGVLKENDYSPYANKQMSCRWDRTKSPLPVVGVRRVSDYSLMVPWLYFHGPLTAAINSKSMENYKGNYIDEPTDEQCNPKDLNHSVLIVGYNVYKDKLTGKETPYWIIKNSWGTKWGDIGYYYLVRGRNACGIESDASYPYID